MFSRKRRGFWHDTSGVTVIEYGIIGAVMMTVCAIAVAHLAGVNVNTYSYVTSAMEQATGGGQGGATQTTD